MSTQRVTEYESGYNVGMNNLPVPQDQTEEWVRGFEAGVDAQFAAMAERYK